jgi:hypothetical protein
MEELINKLQTQHGLNADQAQSILQTITGFIKEKFPMVSGAVDNLFQSGTTPSAPGTTPSEVNSPVDSSAPSENILDKISDFVPGATGQKIEDFAKENLGSFFGNKK